MGRVGPTRTLAVVVADWPAVAAGVAGEASAVVPEPDPARDARRFEAVAAAVATIAPRLEVVEPGRCVLATRGPSRYFGGDEALAGRVRSLVCGVVGDGVTVRVGVAEGPFAAGLAALGDRVVPPGETAGFLAPLPVSVLPVDEHLVTVWRRLGLETLGAFAALSAGDVSARFGPDGARAHRLAAGRDPDPLRPTTPAEVVEASVEFDPPVETMETAVFSARPLAEELCSRLVARGEVCRRLVVEAETDHGERMERVWRHDALTIGAITDRVRWQLDGWLGAGAARRPSAGLTLLRLVADEVVAATGTQLDVFGGRDGVDERVVRALARLAGLLGPEAVRVPEWRGGRDPATQIVSVPAETVDLTAARAVMAAAVPPWPGQVPGPAPTTVYPTGDRRPVEVSDAHGHPVTVNGRAEVSATPAVVVIEGRSRPVVSWAGPWPLHERWWDPPSSRRRARFQVLTADVACSVSVERGRWWLDATYG